jgi:hypothetical protein
MPTITPAVGSLGFSGGLGFPGFFRPAPSIAAVSSTGTTKGAGKMTNTAMNTIGTPPQNSPFTHQPNWIAAPLISTGGSDGTDVFTTG